MFLGVVSIKQKTKRTDEHPPTWQAHESVSNLERTTGQVVGHLATRGCQCRSQFSSPPSLWVLKTNLGHTNMVNTPDLVINLISPAG